MRLHSKSNRNVRSYHSMSEAEPRTVCRSLDLSWYIVAGQAMVFTQ